MIRIESIVSILGILITLPGLASVFPYLDTTAKTAAGAALVGAAVGCRSRFALPGAVQTVLTVVSFLYYGAQFSRDNLVSPAVNLLVLLLAVRLTGTKNARNYLQLFVLSLFILAGSSLHRLDVLFLIYLLLLLFLIGTALVILTFYTAESSMTVSAGSFRRILAVAVLLPAGSLPLMLLFFVIMPRTQYPLWNFLNAGPTSTTGFSDRVTPGASAAVTETKNVVFRAACPRMEPSMLYWRGIVLNTFRNGSWVREEPPERHVPLPANGQPIRVRIVPEPQTGRYLIALNLPLDVEGVRSRRSGDLVFTTGVPLNRRVRYDSISAPASFLKSLHKVDMPFYLRLPGSIPPKIAALGAVIREEGTTARDKIAAVESYFRRARLRYATTGLPTGPDALDDFLFGSRVGHCELFASSVAVILRLAGVPCRLVGGYYGGIYNDVGGYYVVTEDRAHVWVEAFVPGTGWISIDPSSWSTGFSERKEGPGVVDRLRMLADAAAYYWNMSVITYDMEKQVRLLASTGERLRTIDGKKAVGALAISLVTVGAACLIVARIRRWRGKGREERVLQQLFAAVSARFGVEKYPTVGLFEYAASTGSPLVEEFARIYSGAVYRDRKLADEEFRRLRFLVARIKKAEDGRIGG